MFTTDIYPSKIRQAELVREAQQYRLIRSLREAKSPTRDLSSLLRGWIISTLFS
jgi:hypothetical protein